MTTDDDTPGNGAIDAAASEADSDGEPQADPIATLEAEKLDLRDRLMRALADTENMRRRSERDAADARTYAVTNFARDMLTVADNIRRALESVPAGEGEPAPALKTLIEGIELTERDLKSTLGRHGVKLLEPIGGRFDPNMHQAMFEVPDETTPSGTVVQVIQAGYSIGERVLRPALVGIAKGGARPQTAEAGETGPAETADT